MHSSPGQMVHSPLTAEFGGCCLICKAWVVVIIPCKVAVGIKGNNPCKRAIGNIYLVLPDKNKGCWNTAPNENATDAGVPKTAHISSTEQWFAVSFVTTWTAGKRSYLWTLNQLAMSKNYFKNTYICVCIYKYWASYRDCSAPWAIIFLIYYI